MVAILRPADTSREWTLRPTGELFVAPPRKKTPWSVFSAGGRGYVFGEEHLVGFRIDYDENDNVVRVRARGTLTRHGIEQALQQLAGLALRPGYRELVDLRAVREFDIEPLYLRRVAAHMNYVPSAATQGSRRAIVAPSDVGYGMARMYELARGPEPHGDLRVFRNVVEARDWLGISRHRQPPE